MSQTGRTGQPASAAELPLPDMPRRLFVCTPAKLNTYVDCPRRYRMAYVDRPTPPKGPPWAHVAVGAAIHVALRAWWGLARTARKPEQAPMVLAPAWSRHGFRDDAQEREARDRAVAWLEGYLASLDPDDEPLGVERTVAMKTSVVAFSGRADRIDAAPDGAVIVDYKTGRTTPDVDDARGSAALALYALATQQTLRRPCHRVELHHVPTGAVAAHTHTDESLRRQLLRAEATAGDITAAEQALAEGKDPDATFPTEASHRCGWCDFRSVCPDGRRASTELAPWAGLPDTREA